MSTGRKGLELALGAQQFRRHARRRAEFRIRARCSRLRHAPALVHAQPAFPDRSPAPGVPAPGVLWHAEAS